MIKNNQIETVKAIYNELINAKNVSIFSHLNADNDAYAASLGLAIFLKELGVNAKIIGIETITNPDVIKQINYEYSENISYDFIKSSTAIVVDLGTCKNLISPLFYDCKKSLRIDHHPLVENFCNLEWVDIDYSSTSEMIGWFIMATNPGKMNKEICNALYVGILTDSGNLLFPCATQSTFNLIGHFFDYNFDKQKKQSELLLRDWQDIETNYKLMQYIKIIDDQIAYIIIDEKIKNDYHLVDNDSKVFLMSNIKQFKIWFSVYYSNQRKVWKVSIRSREFPVNQIAKKFGGGGHELASGFCIENLDQVNEIINLCRKMLDN